jgi:hypothetical protein
VTGRWGRLHNEELHNLYASPNIIKVVKDDKMGGTCSTHGIDEIRPRSRLENNILMDLRKRE